METLLKISYKFGKEEFQIQKGKDNETLNIILEDGSVKKTDITAPAGADWQRFLQYYGDAVISQIEDEHQQYGWAYHAYGMRGSKHAEAESDLKNFQENGNF